MSSKGENATIHTSKSGAVYWSRFGLGLLSGVLCALLGLNVEGIALGIVIYLISYLIAYYIVKAEVILGRQETFILGLGTYLATWLAFWFLLHTLLSAT